MRIGQGIIFGNRLSQTISNLSTRSPIAASSSITPYTSFTEQWYLHGAALTTQIGSLHLSPYHSNTDIDINLKNDSISSFDESGIHYKPSATTSLKTQGLYTSWLHDNLQIGYNRAEFSFDRPFLDKTQSQSYQVHSLDYHLTANNITYYGEYAQADKKSGTVVGIKTTHQNLQQALIYRQYQKNLPTYLGKPVTQTNSFDNQEGLYYGAKWEPYQRIRVNCYLDIWQSPKSSAEADMPLSGQELLCWARYTSSRHYFSLQYKNQKKEQLLKSDKIGDQKTCDYKIDYHLKIGKYYKIKTRYNYRTYEEESHQFGYLTYAELGFHHQIVSIIGRAAYYKANTPVYMYQQGVDGTMLTSAFSREDLFYYFLATCNILPKTKLQTKYSNYYTKTDREEITIQLLLTANF